MYLNFVYDISTLDIGVIVLYYTFFTLPVSLSAKLWIKIATERQILVVSSLLFIISLLLKTKFSGIYPVEYYVITTVLTLGLTFILETVITSLMAQVISEPKSKSVYNAGLLSALIDTIAKVVGANSMTAFLIIAGDTENLNTWVYPFWILMMVIGMIFLKFYYSKLTRVRNFKINKK